MLGPVLGPIIQATPEGGKSSLDLDTVSGLFLKMVMHRAAWYNAKVVPAIVERLAC